MIQVVEKDLFSPDFLQKNPELLKIKELNIEVDEKLAFALSEYENIRKQIGEIQTETILESCKESVIANLCERFAVNRLISLDDKDGGSVTTLHNARNQVFANDKDRKQFNRKYNSHVYHDGNKLYRERKEELNKLSAEGKLYDDYTGKNISGKQFIIDKNGNVHEQNRFDVEHFDSAKNIHDNDEVRFAMTEEESANLANNEKNLGATASSINRSKADKDFEEWKNIERKEFDNKTNEELYDIDSKLADKKIQESKEYIKKQVAKSKFKKYSSELTKTSLSVAGKTFLYSAIGQISLEFIRALFDSIIEAFNNRNTKTLSELLESFKDRVNEAIRNIKSNWKEILANSFEGAIINLLNNLLVFAINLVATTLKNIVSMIRAGFTTVCSAIKLLCNPPTNMSIDERNNAVCKIFIFGIMEVGSIALTEIVSDLLQTAGLPKNITDALVYPMTALMGGIVASIILGIMQKAKNDAKKERLHVTLIAQNNVVLQSQIIQNWCILVYGNYVLKEKGERFEKEIIKIKSEMDKRNKKNEESLDEIDKILYQI